MCKLTKQTIIAFMGCGLLAVLAGCAGASLNEIIKYQGIKPIYPMPFASMAGSDFEVTVDSLTPTLKWQASGGSQGYDVAVWEQAVNTNNTNFWKGFSSALTVDKKYGSSLKGYDAAKRERKEVRGERIFFAKQVTNNEVMIMPELKSNHLYFWSVKVSGTEQWSTFSADDWVYRLDGGRDLSVGRFYKFRTP